jgi:hypothetical protein
VDPKPLGNKHVVSSPPSAFCLPIGPFASDHITLTDPRRSVESWVQLVRNYSRRKLTVAEDHLPAIDSIANEIEKSWQDEYLYGSWNSWLASLLLWHRPRVEPNNPDHNSQLHRKYIAPSCSWASINCEIAFLTCNNPDAELVDLTIVAHHPLSQPVMKGRLSFHTPTFTALEV